MLNWNSINRKLVTSDKHLCSGRDNFEDNVKEVFRKKFIVWV